MLNAKIVAEVVVLSFVCGIGFGLMISLCWGDRREEKKKMKGQSTDRRTGHSPAGAKQREA